MEEVGAHLRVDGDSLPSELVELLLSHDVAADNDQRRERSALAVAAHHHSTGGSRASLHGRPRAESCAVLSCLSSTESLKSRHIERVVEGQGEKMKLKVGGDTNISSTPKVTRNATRQVRFYIP